MQMQVVADDIRIRGGTSPDAAEPFLSTIREHLSPKEVTARRLDVLKTYCTWLHAQEKEIEITEKLISVKAKLSQMDPTIRTRELVSLKNEEYTLTVDKKRAEWRIKKIGEEITKFNPFGLHSRGRSETNLGESFAQLELMELIAADLEKRDRGALNESRILLEMGALGESREALSRYVRSFKDSSEVDSKELTKHINDLQDMLQSGDDHSAEKNSDLLYSRLPKINASLNQHNRSIFKEFCRSISSESFIDLKYKVPTRSDILSKEITDALLSQEPLNPNSNPSLNNLRRRLWDMGGPWEDAKYAHEEDMQLVQTGYALKKRMQLLREAFDNNLKEIDNLSPFNDRENQRREASDNLFRLYQDSGRLLDNQIDSRIKTRIADFASTEGQEQQRIESMFLIAALSKHMNKNDEDSYLTKLQNGEPTHLPTSSRIYALLEESLSNGDISIPDEILNEIASLDTPDKSPEVIFEALNEKYGTAFEDAYDLYTEIKNDIEPYNAFSILLNTVTLGSSEADHDPNQFQSSNKARMNNVLPLFELEKKIEILLKRLNCSSEHLPEILDAFIKENGSAPEIANYAINFKRKFAL